MLKNLAKAPFPWFGGKSRAAPTVWALLGDPVHYVEPFFGSGAVLLGRPHPCNRPYYSETVNDIDGFVVNFWRAVQADPETVARAASWPVTELDKTARQIALLRWRDAGAAERLAGDAMWYDPVMAGWWAWAVSVQIGAFTGDGPWTADPVSGKITLSAGRGVRRSRPHLTDNGRGVNHPGTREPGVSRNRPHISNNGQGVNHPGTREPGVSRDLPHISDDGQGVNHAGTREPGVLDPPPDPDALLALDRDWGQAFHDTTMPELVRWMRYLCARLRHVRILCGDWSRCVTSGASLSLSVREGKGVAGIFFDPPYDQRERSDGLYAHDAGDIASAVREWCITHGDDPRYRIVLTGFDTEHRELLDHGWTEHEWAEPGYLAGGYGQGTEAGTQMYRERLWASPHCVLRRQESLFDQVGA